MTFENVKKVWMNGTLVDFADVVDHSGWATTSGRGLRLLGPLEV